MQNGQKYILHKQSTLAEGPEKTLDKVKRTRAKRVRQEDDLSPPTQLRPEAVKVMHDTSKKFVESSFNCECPVFRAGHVASPGADTSAAAAFFSSVLRDIRMERLKVRESDTVRFLYLSAFFLEFFLLLYADDEKRGISHLDEERGHDFGLVAEMTEPHAIGFVALRMKNALEEKVRALLGGRSGLAVLIRARTAAAALDRSARRRRLLHADCKKTSS